MAVGVTIGRMIRLRDRQVGEEAVQPPSVPDIPVQTSEERRGRH